MLLGVFDINEPDKKPTLNKNKIIEISSDEDEKQ